MRTVTVLGSTGSIGTQALDVARRRGWRVAALAAGRNAELLLEQAHAFRPATVACAPEVADRLRGALPAGTELVPGDEGTDRVAATACDAVIAAVPGIAGLRPIRVALREGRRVALATKEAMVAAGPLVRETARAHGGVLVPIDSEHAGVDQLLLGEDRDTVEAIVLTASGGPFRKGPADLATVRPEQALAHPTWSMGRKVTIDSATLFNKGLEVLEAHQLFDLPLDRIEVVVHPQSLVHALIRFRDGNLKAHVGPHDMRLPILWGVEDAGRPSLGLEPLPLHGSWTFEPPDRARFPALDLAYRAGRDGGTAPTVLNAADEVAVDAFLEGRLPFPGIADAIADALDRIPPRPLSWDAIEAADAEARRLVAERTARSVP